MNLFVIIIFSLISFHAHAQNWKFLSSRDRAIIPFELVNHIIVIPVELNGEKLSFILDTGVKETLLFGAVDSVILNNVSPIKFQGLGVDHGIDGLLSLNNKLALGDASIIDDRHHLYVIVDTVINLSKNMGVPVHGILGSSFFQNHTIKIDYIKKKMEVYQRLDREDRKIRGYVRLPLTIINEKPFIDVDIYTGKKSFSKSRMLIDLGNSDPVMIFSKRLVDYVIPEPSVYEFLGQGFNGDIYGKRSRISSIKIRDIILNLPFVSHPDTNAYSGRRLVENRVGSVGNQVMSRFDVVLNYTDSCIYLRRNKNFSKPFNINMSGIEVRHEGFTWLERSVRARQVETIDQGVTINLNNDVKYQIELVPSYIIHHVRIISPAYEAGLRSGDVIHKLNGRFAGQMTLDQIKNKLQAKDQLAIKLEVKRGNEILRFAFHLRDPIPLNF